MPPRDRDPITDTAKQVVQGRATGWLIGLLAPFFGWILFVIAVALAAAAILGSVQATSTASGNCGPVPQVGGNNNTQIAYNFLASDPQLGLQPFQAAAIVGNFIHESGGDPIKTNALNSIGAYGIAQWLFGRKTALFAHQFQGKPVDDIYFQLDFVKEELLGSHRSSLDKLKATSDIDSATTIFEANYEVSGDIASYPRRIGFAKSVFQRYANQVQPVSTTQGGKNLKVYVLGDSITLGAKNDLLSTFRVAGVTATVNGSVSRSILRPGITSGNTTSGMDALQTGSVQQALKSSDVLVVALGTNTDGNGSARVYRSNLTRLIEYAKVINPGLKIYAVNIFSPAVTRRAEYNQVLDDLAGSVGFTVIDVASKNIETGSDRIHPTPTGSEAFAQTIASAVTAGSGASCTAISGSGDLNGTIKVDSSVGKIVPVPGQAGTTVDSRILPNVLALVEKYKLKLGDCAVPGPSPGPHTIHGEHPLGLACDIYPDFSRGGSWDLVDQLAAWAEPEQNQPREPFRWVGYNGDYNHGRGNHLHLSWQHAPAAPFTIAAWVKVIG